MPERSRSVMGAKLSMGSTGEASRGWRGGAMMGLMLAAERAVAQGLSTGRRSVGSMSVWGEGGAGARCRRASPMGLARWCTGALAQYGAGWY